MQRRQNKSVFISSTYKDLVDLRKKVADRLHGLFLSVIRMEHFAAGSQSTLENSLHELGKGCNYYILIIGHKYGTIPEGQEISITHSEFRKAVEMKKRKDIEDIFVFKGSPSMLIEQGDIEKDFLREKREKFIKEIEDNKFTYRTFSDDDSLFQGIYETIFQAAHPNTENQNFDEIFEDFEQIKYSIEASLETKSLRVNKALRKITKGFSKVFNLEHDNEPELKHPIIINIKENLEDAIPHFLFDSNLDGRIDRWGIRHVIFRIETAVKLMTAIKDGTSLFNIGEEIGRTASIDLFDRVICRSGSKKLIPVSIKAFIQLFDYWDSSGGWGKLYYKDETKTDDNKGKWTLITRNNFLIDKSGNQTDEEIEHLYLFWKGYITGALNEALNRLSEIYSQLPQDYKRKVLYPPYRKVINVEREMDESDDNLDIFIASFEKHPYGWAYQMLSNTKATADTIGDAESGKIIIFTELSGMLNKLKAENEQHFSTILSKLKENEKTAIQDIISHRHNKINLGTDQCIGLVNSIIQQFTIL